MGNFHIKIQKSTDFAHTFSKNYSRFFCIFKKDYTFYTKNLFIQPKHCVQSIFYNERCKKFRKNDFFSNIFTFLSVIHQIFEYNLRVLANFGKFSRKTQKYTDFAHTFSKNYRVFNFFNKHYTFYTINLLIRPKNYVQSIFFTTKDAKSFVKINFLVTFLHF